MPTAQRLQEDRVLGFLSRLQWLLALSLMCAAATAQQTPKVTLETSETLFSVLTAINSCGYNQELSSSLGLRSAIRAEVARKVEASPQAAEAQEQLCAFYRDHRPADASRDLAQYVSLGLNLGQAPKFPTLVNEADLPPDAGYVLGFVPLLENFYREADLHAIWMKHQAEYEGLVERFHQAVSRMILETEIYLKQPVGAYVGRRFAIYLEPMTAPGQVNARNYGSDYFLVVAPDNGRLPMQEIRHGYLHYVLDPMAMKRATAMKRLEPLLATVQNAPIDESYKHDAALLVTESLIRAIEARTLKGGKAPENQRQELVQSAMEEGFIFAQYFYEALGRFENTPDSLGHAYPDLLYNIELGKEKKRAQAVAFRRQAAPEVVRASKNKGPDLLDLAEARLASGDLKSAKQFAEEALARPQADQGRALFLLARAATLSSDMQGARTYFERTLEVAREPRLVAWSHIYLGRIFDLQDNRDEALKHYRAALSAGDNTARAAAERGIQQPYQPPAGRGEKPEKSE